jgi:flagellar hook-associated protein 3 FlgL
MRITNSMMIDSLLINLSGGMNRLSRYNAQLSSNRRIVRLSDDPIGVLNSMNARQKLNMYKQFESNLVTAREWVDQADSTLLDMNDILTKIKENVVDAAGTKSGTDKVNIGTLIQGLRDSLFQLANQTIGDKYLFAGYNTTKAPFTTDSSGKVLYNGLDLSVASTTPVLGNAIADTANASGFTWNGPITAEIDEYSISAAGDAISIKNSDGYEVYSGTVTTASGTNTLDLSSVGLGTITWTDSGAATGAEVAGAIASAGSVTTEFGAEATQDIQFVVGFNVNMDVSFTGIDIVGTGDTNMFKVLDDLIGALKNNASNDEISSYLTPLQKIQDRVIVRQVEVGARSQRIAALENRYSQDEINYEAIRSNVEDIDQAETIMNYKLSDAIYQQALATGAQIIKPTLMDFLR